MKRNRVSLAKVVSVMEMPSADVLNAPDIVRDYWVNNIEKLPMYDPEKEHLYVLILNTKYNLKAVAHISTGSINESIAHPREVLRPVIVGSGFAFILMHNHPSGDPTASQADIRLTERIRQCADMFQIKMLDHVIVGQHTGRFYSFNEHGLLF